MIDPAEGINFALSQMGINASPEALANDISMIAMLIRDIRERLKRVEDGR